MWKIHLRKPKRPQRGQSHLAERKLWTQTAAQHSSYHLLEIMSLWSEWQMCPYVARTVNTSHLWGLFWSLCPQQSVQMVLPLVPTVCVLDRWASCKSGLFEDCYGYGPAVPWLLSLIWDSTKQSHLGPGGFWSTVFASPTPTLPFPTDTCWLGGCCDPEEYSHF